MIEWQEALQFIPARNRQASGHRAAPAKEDKGCSLLPCINGSGRPTPQFLKLRSIIIRSISMIMKIIKWPASYADEGISGTNTKKREQFKRMMRTARREKIDLVITKSISRFAINTQDCLMYSRKLKNLGIGIIFEKEKHQHTGFHGRAFGLPY